MDKAQLLAYLRTCRYAVIGTIEPDGGPQGALVGVAVTDGLQLVFDTAADSRKHGNLQRNSRIAATLSGPGEQTVQLEGQAHPVSLTTESDAQFRDAYYAAWPDGRERRSWPNIAYWRIVPRWARYSDFDRGPLIVEFDFA